MAFRSPQWALVVILGWWVKILTLLCFLNESSQQDYDNSVQHQFVCTNRCGFVPIRTVMTVFYQMFLTSVLFRRGLAMIRYHSCYPWHQNEYDHFMSAKDQDLKKWVQEFSIVLYIVRQAT